MNKLVSSFKHMPRPLVYQKIECNSFLLTHMRQYSVQISLLTENSQVSALIPQKLKSVMPTYFDWETHCHAILYVESSATMAFVVQFETFPWESLWIEKNRCMCRWFEIILIVQNWDDKHLYEGGLKILTVSPKKQLQWII